MGLVYTYIVHIIPEFTEAGCTATLYMQGWSSTWFNPRTPMLYSVQAREWDLRVAKRYAPIINTRQDAGISECRGISWVAQLYCWCLRCCNKQDDSHPLSAKVSTFSFTSTPAWDGTQRHWITTCMTRSAAIHISACTNCLAVTQFTFYLSLRTTIHIIRTDDT